MTGDAWITAIVVIAVLVALWLEVASPSLLVFSGVVILLVSGVIDVGLAFSGFSNPAPIAVAALFVVARAVSKTGALSQLNRILFGQAGHTRRPLIRMLTPTVITSGFIANSPLVAMLIPQVTGWARRRGSDVSRFLMPLSFGAILGGLLTVIGTSTNLVIDGQLRDAGLEPMGFFEIGMLGLPIAAGGLILVVAISPRLLSKRRSTQDELETDLREYTIEMSVQPGGPMDGKTVDEAKLRHLKGVFLVSIDRADTTIAPAAPTTVLRGDNVLRFVGRMESVLDLQGLPGLVLAEHAHVARLDSPAVRYFSVVVAGDSPIAGQTLRDVGFRSRYQAAVIAIHRAGHRVEGKLGEVQIRVGDTLVVVADAGFRERWQERSDFLLIAGMEDAEPIRRKGSSVTLLILVAMVVVAAVGWLDLLEASLLAALLLILLGILTPDEARRAVDLEVIGVIASAFGLAAAVEVSGLASQISTGIVSALEPIGPVGVLIGVVVATAALTELVTNNAAALLMFPIAVASAPAAGVDPRGMAIAVAIAASASFLTPIGYQTNTMVYGPGGYRFSDYIKVGWPITLLVVVVLAIGIPVLY